MNCLTVKAGKILLNGAEIKRCAQIDIKNINPSEPMEVVLHVDVDEVDVQYSVMQTELHS